MHCVEKKATGDRVGNPQLEAGDSLAWSVFLHFWLSVSGHWALHYTLWKQVHIGNNGELIHGYLGCCF